MIPARGLAAHQSSGSEKNCIVCSFFCIIIIFITLSISISFVVLLNCLYLHPRVLPFVHSPPHLTVRGEGKG